MLMVSDGAGILGKCVKLAFTSSRRSPTPRCDLSASFLPPLFTPVVLPPTRLSLLSHHLSPQTGSQDTGSKSKTDWSCGPLTYSPLSAAHYGPVKFEHQFSV